MITSRSIPVLLCSAALLSFLGVLSITSTGVTEHKGVVGEKPVPGVRPVQFSKEGKSYGGPLFPTKTAGNGAADSDFSRQAGTEAKETSAEWEGGHFPPFVLLPAEIGDCRVVAADEVIMDNGSTLRLSVLARGASAEGLLRDEAPLLCIELGDGYGGVLRRGIYSTASVSIRHLPGDSVSVFSKLEQAGLGDRTMSSTVDQQLRVEAPNNPLLLIDFLSAVQSYVGNGGLVQLIPAREGWGNLASSQGGRCVRLQ